MLDFSLLYSTISWWKVENIICNIILIIFNRSFIMIANIYVRIDVLSIRFFINNIIKNLSIILDHLMGWLYDPTALYIDLKYISFTMIIFLGIFVNCWIWWIRQIVLLTWDVLFLWWKKGRYIHHSMSDLKYN